MIEFEIDTENSVATLRPTQATTLSEVDFKSLTDQIDAYLETHENLQGLVIIAKHFPGWDSFAAFVSHMKFVREHQKSIRNIAIVTDSAMLSAMPSIANHFVKARIRYFPASELDHAKKWAANDEPRAGRFIVLEGFPENVVALKAEGRITSDDYEETLIPLAKAAIEAHGKVKLLYWCGEDFAGFSAGAAWDDARFGMANMSDFSKLAFVSDVGWLRESLKLFSPLISAPVRVFENADFESAKAWIFED